MTTLYIMQIAFGIVEIVVDAWILIEQHKMLKNLREIELSQIKRHRETEEELAAEAALRCPVTEEVERRIEKLIDDYLKN